MFRGEIQFELPEGREQVRSLLREHGLRSTRQREDVYIALATSGDHLTADEVHRSVRLTRAGMSLATVYNTLEALAGAGLCTRLLTTGGAARYDTDVSDHAHVVTADGRIFDVPDDLSERLLNSIDSDVLQEIEHRLGMHLAGLSLELRAETQPSASPNKGKARSRS